MKKDVTDFVVKCLTCQQAKFEHQRPREQANWKWEDITCGFEMELPKTKKRHEVVWVYSIDLPNQLILFLSG